MYLYCEKNIVKVQGFTSMKWTLNCEDLMPSLIIETGIYDT